MLVFVPDGLRKTFLQAVPRRDSFISGVTLVRHFPLDRDPYRQATFVRVPTRDLRIPVRLQLP